MTPIDEDYELTKLIKQGKDTANSDFSPLAAWLDETYQIKTLNIIYDTIDQEERPRLQIILENSDDFFNKNHSYEEKARSEVLKEFEKLLRKNNLIKKYKTENIFAVFRDFEGAAKTEARWNIPKSEVEEFQEKLDIKEIWKVYPEMFYSITFFLYTNEQVQHFMENGMKEYLAEKYFELLKKYDEFGYYNKGNFSIELESKENFDVKYYSNWFYYDRR